MKALRFLLIIYTLAMTAAVYSQAQFKTSENKAAFDYVDATEPYEFQSTSTMSGSGSNLPIAARNSMKIDNSSTSESPHRARKAVEPEEPEGDPTPIGEGMWALLLMAIVYVIYRMRALHGREVAEA